MPDFTVLYQRPFGSSPRPKPLPDGLYPSIIKSYEPAECKRPSISNLMVPCLRVTVGLLDWAPGVSEESKMRDDGQGNQVPIDITQRTFRIDFPTPNDFGHSSWYFLDQFLRSCGLEPDGRSYEEMFPNLTAMKVTTDLGHYTNQQTNEVVNQVNRIFGPHNTR